MKIIYSIISKFTVFITPFILVVFSLTINLTNSGLHKATLKNSDFYNKLSNELQSFELKSGDIQKGFSSILVSSVIKDLASPGWLQNLFEKNIDASSKWLSGETADLGLYTPTKEIETTVAKTLDDKVNKVKQDFGPDILTCTADQSETIKRQGYNLDTQFCLPEQVKSGSQKLTEFMNLSDKDTQNSEFLDKLITNNSLNSFSDTVNVKQLPASNPIRSSFFESLNRVRGGYIFLISIQWYILVSVLILFLISAILANFTGKRLLKFVKKFLWESATGTIVLVALIILSLGGSAYLTSFAQTLLLPGLGSSQLTNLITFEIVKFIFNVLSVAVLFAVGFFILFGIILALEKVGILNRFNKTNKKIQENQKPEIKENKTFDGEFQNSLFNNLKTKNNLFEKSEAGIKEDLSTFKEPSTNFHLPETPTNGDNFIQNYSQPSILETPVNTSFINPNQVIGSNSVSQVTTPGNLSFQAGTYSNSSTTFNLNQLGSKMEKVPVKQPQPISPGLPVQENNTSTQTLLNPGDARTNPSPQTINTNQNQTTVVNSLNSTERPKIPGF